MRSALLAVSGVSVAGLLLGTLGALVLARGAYSFLRKHQTDHARRRERIHTLLGAILIAIAFFLELVSRVGAKSS